MKIISNEEYKALIRKADDADDYKDEIEELKRELREKTRRYKDEVEELNDKHDAEIRKMRRSHVAEKEELEALRALKNDSLEITKAKIAQDSEKAILEAQNAEFESMTKELAKLKTEAKAREDAAREEGEKKGYAEGIGDGLREATKITADDRKMMGQIAALAAASHQSDGAKEIANAIAKDITNNGLALPATAKSKRS